MKEQVLITTGIYPPDEGGPATYIPKLAKFLNNSGYKVLIITLGENNRKFIENGTEITSISRQIPKIIRFCLSVIIIRQQSKNVKAIFSNGLYEETYLSGILRKMPSVCKLVGDPIWERYRNSNDSKVTIEKFQELNLPVSFKLQRILLKKAVSQFTKITTPGIHLKQITERWSGRSDVIFIANGARCQNPIAIKKEWNLITVSRLVSWKNLDFVIESLSGSNLRIAIIGSGPELNKLEEMAKSSNCEIDFLGHIPENKVGQYLGRAQVFIQMSEYEGMSFSLLQAMMNGMCIVTSKARGNADLISNEYNGVTMDVESKENFASLIHELLSDPERMSRYGNNALQTAREKYCEEEQLTKMQLLLGL